MTHKYDVLMTSSLLLTESSGFSNRIKNLFFQLIVAFIWRQIQTVEAKKTVILLAGPRSLKYTNQVCERSKLIFFANFLWRFPGRILLLHIFCEYKALYFKRFLLVCFQMHLINQNLLSWLKNCFALFYLLFDDVVDLSSLRKIYII